MTMRALLLSGAFLGLLANPAWADDGWGNNIEVMSVEDLEANRGGFQIAGLNIDFGATVTTLVNGVPALVTTLTWTDMGAFVEETVGDVGQNIADMTPDQLTALGLDGLENAGGIVIQDEAGVTALVHNITQSSLQNIIINNASGRDLAQQIDVTLTIPGFELMQQSLITESFGIHVVDDMNIFIGNPGG